MFIVGRAVAGSGAAGMIVGALTIISSSVPRGKRPGTFTVEYSLYLTIATDIVDL